MSIFEQVSSGLCLIVIYIYGFQFKRSWYITFYCIEYIGNQELLVVLDCALIPVSKLSQEKY